MVALLHLYMQTIFTVLLLPTVISPKLPMLFSQEPIEPLGDGNRASILIVAAVKQTLTKLSLFLSRRTYWLTGSCLPRTRFLLSTKLKNHCIPRITFSFHPYYCGWTLKRKQILLRLVSKAAKASLSRTVLDFRTDPPAHCKSTICPVSRAVEFQEEMKKIGANIAYQICLCNKAIVTACMFIIQASMTRSGRKRIETHHKPILAAMLKFDK
ncbi:hypothetical protein BDR06DRAFT_505126 [Suillus hirtellus]|nr:hypothetical protein BDR06DRAFT_505126 [Suillus hirtellus]